MKTLSRLGIAAAAVGITMIGQPALAAAGSIYNDIPAPLPGNVDSVGFEATSTSEFGGMIQLGGSHRNKPTMSFVMSSWGCQSGTWSGHDCSTTPGATFSHPITVRFYSVGADNEPGELIGLVRHTYQIPYRPSANFTHCAGDDAGKWYQATTGICYNGKAATLTLSLGSIDLPDNVIVSIAFNTTHYGYNPIGESASCFGTVAGCAYDALNVGTSDSAPTAGAQPLPDDAYVNSSSSGSYCDGGASGTGTFRLDAGCWTGFQPAVMIKAK